MNLNQSSNWTAPQNWIAKKHGSKPAVLDDLDGEFNKPTVFHDDAEFFNKTAVLHDNGESFNKTAVLHDGDDALNKTVVLHEDDDALNETAFLNDGGDAPNRTAVLNNNDGLFNDPSDRPFVIHNSSIPKNQTSYNATAFSPSSLLYRNGTTNASTAADNEGLNVHNTTGLFRSNARGPLNCTESPQNCSFSYFSSWTSTIKTPAVQLASVPLNVGLGGDDSKEIPGGGLRRTEPKHSDTPAVVADPTPTVTPETEGAPQETSNSATQTFLNEYMHAHGPQLLDSSSGTGDSTHTPVASNMATGESFGTYTNRAPNLKRPSHTDSLVPINEDNNLHQTKSPGVTNNEADSTMANPSTFNNQFFKDHDSGVLDNGGSGASTKQEPPALPNDTSPENSQRGTEVSNVALASKLGNNQPSDVSPTSTPPANGIGGAQVQNRKGSRPSQESPVAYPAAPQSSGQSVVAGTSNDLTPTNENTATVSNQQSTGQGTDAPPQTANNEGTTQPGGISANNVGAATPGTESSSNVNGGSQESQTNPAVGNGASGSSGQQQQQKPQQQQGTGAGPAQQGGLSGSQQQPEEMERSDVPNGDNTGTAGSQQRQPAEGTSGGNNPNLVNIGSSSNGGVDSIQRNGNAAGEGTGGQVAAAAAAAAAGGGGGLSRGQGSASGGSGANSNPNQQSSEASNPGGLHSSQNQGIARLLNGSPSPSTPPAAEGGSNSPASTNSSPNNLNAGAAAVVAGLNPVPLPSIPGSASVGSNGAAAVSGQPGSVSQASGTTHSSGSGAPSGFLSQVFRPTQNGGEPVASIQGSEQPQQQQQPTSPQGVAATAAQNSRTSGAPSGFLSQVFGPTQNGGEPVTNQNSEQSQQQPPSSQAMAATAAQNSDVLNEVPNSSYLPSVEGGVATSGGGNGSSSGSSNAVGTSSSFSGSSNGNSERSGGAGGLLSVLRGEDQSPASSPPSATGVEGNNVNSPSTNMAMPATVGPSGDSDKGIMGIFSNKKSQSPRIQTNEALTDTSTSSDPVSSGMARPASPDSSSSDGLFGIFSHNNNGKDQSQGASVTPSQNEETGSDAPSTSEVAGAGLSGIGSGIFGLLRNKESAATAASGPGSGSGFADATPTTPASNFIAEALNVGNPMITDPAASSLLLDTGDGSASPSSTTVLVGKIIGSGSPASTMTTMLLLPLRTATPSGVVGSINDMGVYPSLTSRAGMYANGLVLPTGYVTLDSGAVAGASTLRTGTLPPPSSSTFSSSFNATSASATPTSGSAASLLGCRGRSTGVMRWMFVTGVLMCSIFGSVS